LKLFDAISSDTFLIIVFIISFVLFAVFNILWSFKKKSSHGITAIGFLAVSMFILFLLSSETATAFTALATIIVAATAILSISQNIRLRKDNSALQQRNWQESRDLERRTRKADMAREDRTRREKWLDEIITWTSEVHNLVPSSDKEYFSYSVKQQNKMLLSHVSFLINRFQYVYLIAINLDDRLGVAVELSMRKLSSIGSSLFRVGNED